MMPRHDALPASLPPRILRPMLAAAQYVGVGEGTFRKLIDSGKMPAAIKIGRRCQGWDRLALDRAVEKLGAAPATTNPWDTVL